LPLVAIQNLIIMILHSEKLLDHLLFGMDFLLQKQYFWPSSFLFPNQMLFFLNLLRYFYLSLNHLGFWLQLLLFENADRRIHFLIISFGRFNFFLILFKLLFYFIKIKIKWKNFLKLNKIYLLVKALYQVYFFLPFLLIIEWAVLWVSFIFIGNLCYLSYFFPAILPINVTANSIHLYFLSAIFIIDFIPY
jgi:hypothetical protein